MGDTFRNRFIQAKEIRNVRWIDIANKSGLDKAQISQYKNGVHEPEQDALYKLATALNVNVAWLMGHDVPMEVNRHELEQKVSVCDLLEKQYGSNTFEMIELFSKLDDIDKIKVMERIHTLLEDEKYSVKKESSNAKAI